MARQGAMVSLPGVGGPSALEAQANHPGAGHAHAAAHRTSRLGGVGSDDVVTSHGGSARCRLRRSERHQRFSSLKTSHRSGIGTGLISVDLRLPRFHRACPSTALDERVVNCRAVFEIPQRMSNQALTTSLSGFLFCDLATYIVHIQFAHLTDQIVEGGTGECSRL